MVPNKSDTTVPGRAPEEEIPTGEPKQPKKTVGRGASMEDYHCRNLKFLTDFFIALGVTPHSYAKLTPNPASTAVGLRYQLNNDDMKVSKAMEIVDRLGYTLNIRFTEKPAQKTEPGTKDASYIVHLPVQLRERKAGTGNLGFIDDLIRDRRMSKRGFAEAIGMSPGAVFTWFKLDDVAISYLVKIKEALDVNLEFNILPKKKEDSKESNFS